MMAPHQERVVAEKHELDGRCDALTAFFMSPVFTDLRFKEQDLLGRQSIAMRIYSNILGERIAAFEVTA